MRDIFILRLFFFGILRDIWIWLGKYDGIHIRIIHKKKGHIKKGAQNFLNIYIFNFLKMFIKFFLPIEINFGFPPKKNSGSARVGASTGAASCPWRPSSRRRPWPRQSTWLAKRRRSSGAGWRASSRAGRGSSRPTRPGPWWRCSTRR